MQIYRFSRKAVLGVCESFLKILNRMAAPSRALDFAGQVAIVTGAGCRSSNEVGNGRAVAILLARHGAKVTLVDLNVEWAKETQRLIGEEGGISHFIEADVSKELSCKHVVDETIGVFGAVNLLVNNGNCQSSAVLQLVTLKNMLMQYLTQSE